MTVCPSRTVLPSSRRESSQRKENAIPSLCMCGVAQRGDDDTTDETDVVLLTQNLSTLSFMARTTQIISRLARISNLISGGAKQKRWHIAKAICHPEKEVNSVLLDQEEDKEEPFICILVVVVIVDINN